MEIEAWVQVYKSLASSLVELSQNESNLFYFYLYALTLLAADTRQLRLSFLLFMVCVIVSNSIIYDSLDSHTLHLGYSIIYLYGVRYVKELKTIIALCLLAWFNVIMSWDAYHYATTETWLYLNYERITACLHVAIVFSCINWRKTIDAAHNIVNSLRHLWLNNCHFLYL